ncbi:MAG TPA: hypothetical protein PK521_06680 [Bacteroidales bacterium]|nr:hypothetical protein [Bacteroidales bacterium]
MTAGNYMQPEQRPFEIMTQYILPSLETVNTDEQKMLTDFIGEFQINETESIKIDIKDSSLIAIDPAGITFKLIRKSNFSFITEDKSREVQFVTDQTGTISIAEIYVKGQKVETLKKTK